MHLQAGAALTYHHQPDAALRRARAAGRHAAVEAAVPRPRPRYHQLPAPAAGRTPPPPPVPGDGGAGRPAPQRAGEPGIGPGHHRDRVAAVRDARRHGDGDPVLVSGDRS